MSPRLRTKTAFVAQWIERLVPVQKAAGPIPAESTRRAYGLVVEHDIFTPY